MIDYLIKRPIAVLVSVLAFVILGGLAYFSMPVSLLPDIDIPHLKVQINYPKNNARSIENSITRPLRQQLTQLSGLKSIHSESREGAAEIWLEFDYETKTDYAYFEANEKIDGIISQLPKELSRPLVIKEKPSDIPIFYINIIPTESFYSQGRSYPEFSELVKNDIRRRMEQLDEISLVDISGLSYSQIIVEPKSELLAKYGISHSDISETINNNSLKTESLKFSKGHYTYNLKLLSPELSLAMIRNLKVYKNGKVFNLNDIAIIKEEKGNANSMFVHQQEQGISLAIYKQSNARMSQAKAKIASTIKYLENKYPLVQFSIERDQTQLLQFSINNLIQTLILSILFASLIIALFFRKIKFTFIVAISILVSILISFFFLQLANISINIISLSGLVLSVGLMIDNSIIVLDNINQYKEKMGLQQAIIKGTNEIIRPLLSSVLTTIAVFLPLITISGISGALFYDQAVTICIGLISSFLVSIFVIPVFYKLFISANYESFNTFFSTWLLGVYDKSLSAVLRKKILIIIPVSLLFITGFLLIPKIEKQRLPDLSQSDLICMINWNENISLEENNHRVELFVKRISNVPLKTSSYIGENEFILSGNKSSKETAVIYIDFNVTIDFENLKADLTQVLKQEFPLANIQIKKADNVFNKIFDNSDSEVSSKIRIRDSKIINESDIFNINEKIKSNKLLDTQISESKFNYTIKVNFEKMLLYHIDYRDLVNELKVLFGGSLIEEVNQGNQSLQIILREQPIDIIKSIRTKNISNSNGIQIPISSLISVEKANTPNAIWADNMGEYINCTSIENNDNKHFRNAVISSLSSIQNIDISFQDIKNEQKSLFSELLKVLLISLLLLYLILAAQFESLFLPIIILAELAIDLSGALLFLYLFDISINIMSGLGMIVMSGIIINDSIIKIDTIHKTYKETNDLNKAIKIGGHRRFLPIIMTSLTTVLALLPLLFFSGMGVELQLPLAISIIGGLSVGTLVSLFLIPLFYSFYVKISHT